MPSSIAGVDFALIWSLALSVAALGAALWLSRRERSRPQRKRGGAAG